MLNFGRAKPNRFARPYLARSSALRLPVLKPQKLGGGEEARTPDLRLAKPALCQTELRPHLRERLVAGAGFEPATFGL